MLFGKPFENRGNTMIKSSDRKKLLSSLKKSSRLSSLTASLSCSKITLRSGARACIYSSPTLPLFFTLDLDDTLFPTVYLLWRIPNVLPDIQTMPFAMSKLENGADLMAPGVLGITGTFEKNDVVAISVDGIPYAVGRAVMSDGDMKGKSTGKVVLVLHVFRDLLWESGDKSGPVVEEMPKIEKLKIEEPVVIKPALTTGEMDEYLRVSFLTALFDWPVDNAELLPITASVFYSDYVLKSRPDETLIDLKLTSYKKVCEQI
jgi:translation initiation factor 2D